MRHPILRRALPRRDALLLYYKPNVPLAVLEAKDNNHAVGDGMQQALEYAEILDVPFAYSSNGDSFLEHDRTVTTGTVTREIPLGEFPTPDELWARYCAAKGWSASNISMKTAASSLSRSPITPARPSAQPTPHSTHS